MKADSRISRGSPLANLLRESKCRVPHSPLPVMPGQSQDGPHVLAALGPALEKGSVAAVKVGLQRQDSHASPLEVFVTKRRAGHRSFSTANFLIPIARTNRSRVAVLPWFAWPARMTGRRSKSRPT